MTQYQARDTQFGLAALLEYTTVCAILAALSGVIGIGASICLMAMALSLGAGYGLWALTALMCACLASGMNDPTNWANPSPFDRQVVLLLTVVSICVWYVVRRKNRKTADCKPADLSADEGGSAGRVDRVPGD